MARWTLIVRNGPRVERAVFSSLGLALSALETRLDELAPQARRDAVDVLKHRYDAVLQVAVRAEISGPRRLLPRVRGGVDLRGDGSIEAFTGHWRRSLVATRPPETAHQALRRMLGAPARADLP